MRQTILAATLLGALATSGGVLAHEGHHHDAMGTVKAVNAEEMTLTVSEEETLTFALMDETSYVRGDEAVPREDVTVGEQPDQEALYHRLLADDDPTHLGEQTLDEFALLLDLLLDDLDVEALRFVHVREAWDLCEHREDYSRSWPRYGNGCTTPGKGWPI